MNPGGELNTRTGWRFGLLGLILVILLAALSSIGTTKVLDMREGSDVRDQIEAVKSEQLRLAEVQTGISIPKDTLTEEEIKDLIENEVQAPSDSGGETSNTGTQNVTNNYYEEVYETINNYYEYIEEFDGTITSEEIVDGTITNDDIAALAGLSWSKIDKTGAQLSDFGGILLHSDLGQLSADDHTIYALLAGRAGGQSQTGGTAAGDDLVLDSTSNASKGYIILNPAGGNVGLGLSDPTASLHLAAFSDEVQLKVGAHASQTNDILQILKSDGTSKLVFVDSSGTLRFDNEATIYEDLRVPGFLLKSGTVAPDQIDFNGNALVKVNGFNGGGTSPVEDVIFNVQMPHAWKEGTIIYPHVHWAPSTSGAGNVVWKLEYAWGQIGGTFPAFQTIVADPQSTESTAWKHKLASLPTISGSGKTLSSILICRLYREPGDVGDTYTGDAALLDFDFHYEINSLGSNEEYTK